jgi:hypothetical protein
MAKLRRAAIALLAVATAGSACERTTRSASTPTGPTSITTSTSRAVAIDGTVTDLDGAAVGGASVTGTVGTARANTTTDESGRFSLGTFEASSSQQMTVVIASSGYVTANLGRPASSVDARWTLNVKLPRLFTLPIDDSLTAVLLTTDPGDYVGDPYDSDYSSNTKYIAFTTPAASDVVVELGWEPIGNASLMMWALGGAIVSQPSDGRQVLRLPHGTSGMLLVGQPYAAGRLLQSVAFTLATRTVPPAHP